MLTDLGATCRPVSARGLIAVALLSLLAGCGGEAPPPPGAVQITIAAASDINPDAAAHPYPVTLRTFQLSAIGAFDADDYFQIGDGAGLGRDLLAQDKLSVAPGDTRVMSQPLKEGARYLAVIAAFRQIDRAAWKSVVAVPPHGTTELKVELTGTRVTIKAINPS